MELFTFLSKFSVEGKQSEMYEELQNKESKFNACKAYYTYLFFISNLFYHFPYFAPLIGTHT